MALTRRRNGTNLLTDLEDTLAVIDEQAADRASVVRESIAELEAERADLGQIARKISAIRTA